MFGTESFTLSVCIHSFPPCNSTNPVLQGNQPATFIVCVNKELVGTVAKFWFIWVEGVISASLESLGLITQPSEL